MPGFPLQHLETRQTRHQSVAIWGHEKEVEFRVTGAIHAWWGQNHFLTGLAWDSIAAGVLSLPGAQPRSLLMLGLGGGTSLRTLRHLCPNLKITAIEIDETMIQLARDYMGLDALKIEVIAADAYQWLAANRQTFDVIFDDVYGVTSTDVARPLPSPQSLLPDLHRSLTPNGLFAANLVTGPGHRSVQSEFRRFFRDHFDSIRSITTPASLNECLVGGPALHPWQAIRSLSTAFPSDTDYSYWRRLRSRRF